MLVKLQKDHKGLTLIEMSISLGIIGLVTAGIWELMSEATNRMQDQAAARHHKEIVRAAQDYITTNIGAVSDHARTTVCSGAAASGTFALDALGPGNDPITFLQNAGLLGANTSLDETPFGESYGVNIHVPDCSADTLSYEVMVYTDGSSALPAKRVRSIAGMIGANGGYVDELTGAGTAQGAFGNWQAATNDFTAGGERPVVGSVAAVSFYSGGALTTNYLHRYPVPGYVQANRMFTAITWHQPTSANNEECNDEASQSGYSICNAGNVIFYDDSGADGNDLILAGNDIIQATNIENRGYLRVYSNEVSRSGYSAPYDGALATASARIDGNSELTGVIVAENDIMSDTGNIKTHGGNTNPSGGAGSVTVGVGNIFTDGGSGANDSNIFTIPSNGRIFTVGSNSHIFTMGESATIYTEGEDATIYTKGESATIYTEGNSASIYTEGVGADIYTSANSKIYTGDVLSIGDCDVGDVCAVDDLRAMIDIVSQGGDIYAENGNIRADRGRIHTGTNSGVASCTDLDICSAKDLRAAADLYIGGNLEVIGNTTIGGTLMVAGAARFGTSVSVGSFGDPPVVELLPNGDVNANGNVSANGVRTNSLATRTNTVTEIAVGSHLNGSGVDFSARTFRGQSFLYTSDERLKDNVAQLDNQLDKLLQLRGVGFDWKEAGSHDIGLIAQDVEKVYPDLVKQAPEGYKAVQYANLIGPIIEALRELKAENENLKAELTKLQ